MILIVGGTTEGRAAVGVADEAGSPYYYSTKGALQEIRCLHGTRLTGALDREAMTAFCRAHSVRLIIDAAHPFALGVHRTTTAVTRALQIPVVRYERAYPPRDEDFVWCDDYADAVRRLQEAGIRRLLALTGVNTIAPLSGYWQSNRCWFRILNREESLSIARAQGFPPEQLVFYRENEAEAVIRRLQPAAILTKESGYAGGFTEKAEAARKLGIPLYVVKRPRLDGFFYTVNGEEGLRKQIERLAPGFFPLRSGYTTGVCAVAAAKAALLYLLGGRAPEEVSITLPSGEPVTLPVASGRRTATSAVCTVVKESGDDPDVTNGCRLVAQVEVSSGRDARGDARANTCTDVGGDTCTNVDADTCTNAERDARTDVDADACTTIDANTCPDVEMRACPDEERNGAEKPASPESSAAEVLLFPEKAENTPPGFPADAAPVTGPIIRLRAGEGIGRVTLPGLGLEIGGPAVNATPRRMIARELAAVWRQARPGSREGSTEKSGQANTPGSAQESATGPEPRNFLRLPSQESGNGQNDKWPLKTEERPEIVVTLSVPGGEALALRTFNPKLGIVGGISIIGTSGIVRPFSTEAFIASIRKEAEVAKAIGCTRLVLNSGAKSERFLKNRLAAQGEMPPHAQAFIHYGNFIGETVRIAASLGFREVILGIMIGKAVKLAEGALDTHSKKGIMNKSFLQSLARESGCGETTVARIGEITLGRELPEVLLKEEAGRFFPLLLRRCHAQLAPLLPGGTIRLLLIGDDGTLLHQTT